MSVNDIRKVMLEIINGFSKREHGFRSLKKRVTNIYFEDVLED